MFQKHENKILFQTVDTAAASRSALFPPFFKLWSFPAPYRCSLRQHRVWSQHFLRLWTSWFGTLKGGTRAWPSTCATLLKGKRPCCSGTNNHLRQPARRTVKIMTMRVCRMFYRSDFTASFPASVRFDLSVFPSRCSSV